MTGRFGGIGGNNGRLSIIAAELTEPLVALRSSIIRQSQVKRRQKLTKRKREVQEEGEESIDITFFVDTVDSSSMAKTQQWKTFPISLFIDW